MGFAKLGAMFGVFLGAVLMHAFGRKLTIEWTGLFFIMGPLIMSVARAWPALVPPLVPPLALRFLLYMRESGGKLPPSGC